MENLIFPLVLLFVLVLVVCVKRKRIKELRQKYGNTLRDVLRIATINLSYAQINSSLPQVLTVPWPDDYLLFLGKMDFVNFDIMGLVGIDCVNNGVDFRWRVAMASFVPIGLLLSSGVVYLCRQTNIKEDDPVVRHKIVNDLFASADVDDSGWIDVTEFENVLDEMQQPKTTVEALQTQMKELGARTKRGNVVLSREAFVDAAIGHKLETLLGTHWVKQVALSRARSERWSNTLILLFLMHAPVSQRLFYYFSCVEVGQKKYLVQDYSIECWREGYNGFAVYVVFMLVVFTFGLPLLVSGMLLINRKTLYNPKVHATMGFLYARFQKGSEFWEMHEVVRKCALMGLLIFLPPTSRAAVGILICVLCCCTLNFFQPHRNKTVLCVSQMSFLMTTFKYVCAVFLRLNDLQREDTAVMGWVMVMLDVLFMLGSVVAVVVIVVLLRASANLAQPENKALVAQDNDGGGGGGGERSVSRRSLVQVVPTPQEDEQQQQKSSLKKEIAALKWQKNIRQALMKHSKPPLKRVSTLTRVKSTRTRTVEEIQRTHANHRDLALKNIERQHIKRRSSLQLRVQARNKNNSDGQETRGSDALFPKGETVVTEKVVAEKVVAEKVVAEKAAVVAAAPSLPTVLVPATNTGATQDSIEKFRLTLGQIMKTPVKFQTWLACYDKASTGLMLRVHMVKMIQKVVKKTDKRDVKEGFVEVVWASMKQGSGEEVAWGVIEHEVVKRWVFLGRTE